jgi:hypothetical protein
MKKKYYFPRIDDHFGQLKDVKVFSKINLRSRYHQLRTKDEDLNKTSFIKMHGHYQFVVVPIGLSNALVVFMCLMNGIFKKYLDNFVIFSLDGILIYSHYEDKYYQH